MKFDIVTHGVIVGYVRWYFGKISEILQTVWRCSSGCVCRYMVLDLVELICGLD